MLRLSQDEAADQLLSEDPLALLIGMVLDQQVPLEWAFSAPLELKRRLGGVLDVRAIAAMDPDALAEAFSARPSLHRYPGSMAGRVGELARTIVTEYGGDPAAIWTGAGDGRDLLRRIKALPGFGDHKAKIFVALLGKQLGIRPDGWEHVSLPFSGVGTLMSVADIVDGESLAKVRLTKQAAKQAAKAAASGRGTKKAASKPAADKARARTAAKAAADKAPARPAPKVPAQKVAGKTAGRAAKVVPAGNGTRRTGAKTAAQTRAAAAAAARRRSTSGA